MRSITVLAIDDDLVSLMLMKRIFQGLDKRVQFVSANGWQKAVDLLERGEVDPAIILLDVNMPRTDGFECLEKIRSIDRTKNLPVLMMSSSTSENSKSRSESMGACGYFVKPFDLEESRAQLEHIYHNWLLPLHE